MLLSFLSSGPAADVTAGVTSHGLSCEVCKFKSHKRCAVKAINNCKWTTLASVGKDIIEDDEGVTEFLASLQDDMVFSFPAALYLDLTGYCDLTIHCIFCSKNLTPLCGDLQ